MKGSTWHRWDLHYHTPSSYDHHNKSKTNQEIVDELLADNVSAVVISDHHRIDFSRINELNKIANGKIKFFRGIEITSELGGSTSIHFIAIFPDALEEYQIRDDFLAPLGITEEKTSKDNSLYQTAISYKDFLEKAKSIGAIITVHAGKKSNSIENIANWCKSKQEFKKSLLEKVDILETSKKEDIVAYKEIVFKSIGKVCPIIVGSDYHAEYDYGYYRKEGTNPENLEKRDATWIKADLTFEGLKQIVFEPELRVRLQENNPSSEKFGLKIETLKIEKSKLFNSKELYFNEDMIAVIGEKGSGKTALLDMVAHALGTKQEDSSSFLQRAKSELKNSIIKFNLFGDAVQTISFMDNISTCKCRYINPAKLSSFCEEETSMQEFIKSILLHDEISKENNAILETNLEIQSKILRIGSIDEQLVQLDQVEKIIEELKGKIEIEEKNKPNLPTVDETSKEKFSQLNINIEAKNKELEELQAKHARLLWFNSNKDKLLSESADVVRKKLYEDISTELDYEEFKINFSYDFQTINKLQQYEAKTYSEKEALKSNLEKELIEFEQIKSVVFKNNESQERYEKWQKYIQELHKELISWEKKKEGLTLLQTEREQIIDACVDLYISNIESKKRIFKYYRDLKEQLSTQIGSVDKNKITFEPVFKLEDKELFMRLETVLSLKSVNEEVLRNNITDKYQKHIERLITSDTLSKEKIYNILNLFVINDAKKNLYNKSIEGKIFKVGHGYLDLYKVAFMDFITINYDIAFNSIPMDQLSSGQKGIVLLKLLLRLDKSTDPLLIDQPEDNLDNKSVYDQLVEEFKIIKQKRQLLIATHNPNLVINTDAEQVIVAEYRKGSKNGYISYESGSIENPEIRDKICKILEGGKDAFINRERRYNFKI